MLLIFPPFVITVVDDDDLSRRIETRKATTRDERGSCFYINKLLIRKGFWTFWYLPTLLFCAFVIGR